MYSIQVESYNAVIAKAKVVRRKEFVDKKMNLKVLLFCVTWRLFPCYTEMLLLLFINKG